MKSHITWISVILFIIGCKSQEASIVQSTNNDYIRTSSGLQYKILKKGTEEKAQKGDNVLLRETTTYRDGTLLYTNEDSDSPLKIKFGAGTVTDGVEEGLLDMQTNEIKKMIVPPYLAKRRFYPDNIHQIRHW